MVGRGSRGAADEVLRAAQARAVASDGAPELAGLAMCGFFAFAWLVPNHFLPWTAFHSDAIAGAGLLVGSFGTLVLAGTTVRWPMASVVVGLMALVPLVQWGTGLVFFLGDAAMAALYLSGFALALQTGATLQRRGASALRPLLVTLLLVGLASLVIAILQWLRIADILGGFATDLDRLGRPFANFAQPNQLATFLILSLCATFALHQQGRLSTPALVAAAAWLSFGIALTRSRAGLLEMACLIGLALALHSRAGLRFPRAGLVGLGIWFAGIVSSWTILCDWLYLSDVRDGTMGSSNGRTELWQQLAHAAWQRPWSGYGWNQVAVAQSNVAAMLPPFPLQVEHSHNLLLDLVLWNGLPLGLLLAAMGAGWLWRHGRAGRDGVLTWYLIAIMAFLAHAMVEFPHDYAYLLFPIGLMAGALEADSGAGRFVELPRRFAAALPATGLAMLVWVFVEYAIAEADYRAMRLENARIGTGVVSDAVPSLVLLTQLHAFLHVARHSVTASMEAEDLERLRSVSERYAYPPVLFRRALAEALNGNPTAAADMFRRLCHMHEKRHCLEALDAWTAMAATQPQLTAVALPTRP